MLLNFLFTAFLFSSAHAQIPSQPTESAHPGSADYKYQVKKERFQVDGRSVDVFLPVSSAAGAGGFPLIAFGHGQAIDVQGYEKTFEHLAKKGVVVIHPGFDNGFFDQDWRRMASDFNRQVGATLRRYGNLIDAGNIVYSGHSKGAYVALMAAGAPNLATERISPTAVVLFAPAGFDGEYLRNLDPGMAVTLIYSDSDTVIQQSLISDIYSRLNVEFKQWITVQSYQNLKADHFYPLSKSYFFGGRNGVSAYHYHGMWKWLLGAVWNNSYLYGDDAISSGVEGLLHKVQRKTN